MKSERIFNEAGPGFTCQLDNIFRAIILQHFLCRMPHKKRKLMLQTATIMATTNIDVRAAVLVHVRQIKKELQHTPVIKIEMIFEGRTAQICLGC